MMFKKGQAAMEFLMTYGWAILVVLIAIGALAYFGVLNPNKFIGDRCTVSTGSGLFCEDSNSQATGTFVRVVIKNALADPVVINPLTFTYNNGVATCASGALGAVPADARVQINLTCASIGAAGTKIKGDLKIDYTVGTAGLAKSTTGSLVVTVQ